MLNLKEGIFKNNSVSSCEFVVQLNSEFIPDNKISKKTFRKNNDSVLKIPKIRFRRKKIKDEQKEKGCVRAEVLTKFSTIG